MCRRSETRPLARACPTHLVEVPLKALSPQAQTKKAKGGMIRRQLLGANPQEALKHHVPSDLILQLPVREVVEELQKYQLKHEHRVQGSRPQST